MREAIPCILAEDRLKIKDEIKMKKEWTKIEKRY
jgi:hypothetical protein